MVRTWTEWLSEAYFHQRNSRGSKESLTRAEAILKRVTANLEAVAAYKLHISDTSGALISDTSNTSYRVKSTTETYHDTFDEDSPLDWVIDSDKIDDIETSKA